MKQLTIICKKCGKVLRTKSYQGAFNLNALEVNPCPNCLAEAIHYGILTDERKKYNGRRLSNDKD